MKLTPTGYRISKNGAIIYSIEKEAITKDFKTNVIKEQGIYYFFARKQGKKYIYLP